MLSPDRTVGRESIVVRLADVPIDLREQVAEKLIARAGLSGVDELEMRLAAIRPVENPELTVAVDKAEMVVLRGRQPTGAGVWAW